MNWAESLANAAKRSLEYSEKHLTAIGFVCLIGMPASSFVEKIVADPFIDTLPIRTVAGVVGGALIFRRSFRIGLKIYWVISMTFVLPFTFGYMLIHNAAATPVTEVASSVWNYQYLVALFFFIHLIHHGALAFLLWALATMLALASLLTAPNVNWIAIQAAFLLPLPVYITAMLLGGLMNRNVAMVQREKLRAASAIGANIAHELRTPLASISAIARGTSNLLPMLTDVYSKSKDVGADVAPLRSSQIDKLNTALETIEEEVNYSNTVIDILLANTQDELSPTIETEIVSASEIIRVSAERYPFNNQRERELIRTEIPEDFCFLGPRLLLIHVMFNLIKNALLFVQKKGGGQITLLSKIDGSDGKLVIKDTGTGIPSSVLPHIFERFYTTTPTSQSAGIGLSFCKLVVESMNGQITCESKEGEYTTFTLTFPLVTDETPDPHSEQESPDSEAGAQTH